MLLTGTFYRSLDEKQRLAIPKPLRESMGHNGDSVFYLRLEWTDRCRSIRNRPLCIWPSSSISRHPIPRRCERSAGCFSRRPSVPRWTGRVGYGYQPN